jgi:mannose-6-phosphate isomerase-like protein (cupin superfamily)
MDYLTSPGRPIQLGSEMIVHLPGDLSVRSIAVDSGYWNEREGRAELAEGRILSVFSYDSTWMWWERHPVGDEFAYLLDGEVELGLDDGQHHHEVGMIPGDSIVIPARAWHTLRVMSPSTLLFITPTPAGTEHR